MYITKTYARPFQTFRIYILDCQADGDDSAWRKRNQTFFEFTDNLQRSGVKVSHSGSLTAVVKLRCNTDLLKL